MNGESCFLLWSLLGKYRSDTSISEIWPQCANKQCLLDEPDLLPRLRAGVRPPMTMEEHVDRLEALYAGCVPISSGLAALQDNCSQLSCNYR